MKKLFAILLLSVSVFFGWKNVAGAKGEEMISCGDLTERIAESREDLSEIRDSVPKSVIAYAKEIYVHMCKVAEKDLGKKLDYQTLRLGEPYIIYDVEKKGEQDAVFYFPIESGEHVYLTLEVIQTDEGMKGGISPATGIYQKKSLYEHSIFYKDQENIHAQAISPISVSSKRARIKEFNEYDSFSDLDAYTKINVISHQVKEYRKIKTKNLKADPDAKEGYSPGFSVEGKGKRVCNSGPYMVSQANESICWAACVASIYNYFFNKHISAKTVSKKILGKYACAQPKQVVKAFKTYHMDVYKHANYPISYDKIMQNILHKRMMIAMGISMSLKHDVVVTGYHNSSKKKEVKIYDPSEDAWKWIVPGNKDARHRYVFASKGNTYVWSETYYVY